MHAHTLVPVIGHLPELAKVAAMTAPLSQSISMEHNYNKQVGVAFKPKPHPLQSTNVPVYTT